jgi:CDGSH-type Zn-finger protein
MWLQKPNINLKQYKNMKFYKAERPTCGCGNTSDPDGFCDGSHANKQQLNYLKK